MKWKKKLQTETNGFAEKEQVIPRKKQDIKSGTASLLPNIQTVLTASLYQAHVSVKVGSQLQERQRST